MNRMLLTIYVGLCCINLIYTTTYTCDPSISCGCSSLFTTVTSRIVGGEAAADYAWGWMVSLQQSDKHICGASLLTSEYAVTAAHCLEDIMDSLSELSILAGTNYLDNEAIPTIQRRPLISAIMHPKYDKSSTLNDIAILKFSPLTISSDSKLAFICLPKQYEEPFQTNTDLIAIGWGFKSQYIRVLSNTLQQVTVQAFSSASAACQQSGMVNSFVQFCAGTIAGGKDGCLGDSGGPLMAFVNRRWVLAGIASNGKGCGQVGYPGVYTRVSAFIPFINSNVDFPVTEPITDSSPPSTTEYNNNQSIQKKSWFNDVYHEAFPTINELRMKSGTLINIVAYAGYIIDDMEMELEEMLKKLIIAENPVQLLQQLIDDQTIEVNKVISFVFDHMSQIQNEAMIQYLASVIADACLKKKLD
ncbi:unnamed protein product [Rotaria sordida]|uniref:Peptidase S1 domain-containing protein n=1 Tax=Rotaria sordida TaxID=392033 RepID=A0A818VMX7_9BILA|nr:unnamed protein product [Rotaria sordida]